MFCLCTVSSLESETAIILFGVKATPKMCFLQVILTYSDTLRTGSVLKPFFELKNPTVVPSDRATQARLTYHLDLWQQQ